MAGYVYAHLSLKWLGPRRQAVLHVVLLCLAWIGLPIGVAQGWTPPSEGNPAAWLAAADSQRGAAVFLRFGQRAGVTGLVRPLRRTFGERPLFSLRGQ